VLELLPALIEKVDGPAVVLIGLPPPEKKNQKRVAPLSVFGDIAK